MPIKPGVDFIASIPSVVSASTCLCLRLCLRLCVRAFSRACILVHVSGA